MFFFIKGKLWCFVDNVKVEIVKISELVKIFGVYGNWSLDLYGGFCIIFFIVYVFYIFIFG